MPSHHSHDGVHDCEHKHGHEHGTSHLSEIEVAPRAFAIASVLTETIGVDKNALDELLTMHEKIVGLRNDEKAHLLHGVGHFAWSKWGEMISAELVSDRDGTSELGYDEHWMNALEKMVSAKGLSSTFELKERAQAWRSAAERTPHGQPIELHPNT